LGHTDQPSSSNSHDKKRKADHSTNAVERPRHNKEYWPKLGEFEGSLDRICIFHPHGKHKTRDCDRLQGFAGEVLKMAKGVDQEKMPEEPKGDFPEAHKYDSRRRQKHTALEVMAVSPTTPKYLEWSEVSITFDRSDHPDFVRSQDGFLS
jgi:hypothetical protein